MRVFLTGATGFVGEEVLGQLGGAGHTARILARHPDSARVRKVVSRYGVEVHSGDVTDGPSLAPGLKDVGAVIHLVGIISEVGRSTFESVHTLGTLNMVVAAQKAGVKRFVQMSALGARADSGARYHRSKWAAEEAVRGSALDWTIFRPSIIYGRGDHFVNLFANMSRWSPVLPVMGSGHCGMRPIPVADVAGCFVKALTETRSIGQTYDLAGLEAMSLEEVLDAIMEVTERRRWKLHVTMPLARMQAALLEFTYGKLLGKPPPLNRDQLIMLDEESPCDPQPANELFGLRPIPFREGIAAYLRRKPL